jgi:ATP-dependent Lhr-like helicase
MLAPTGSGKTLAAFLWCLDRLMLDDRSNATTRVVYVSPIKALAYDVERNLRAPLVGLHALGADKQISIDVRTGDTTAKERERQRKTPGQILITTPESLYLLLAGRSRDRLRTVDTVIVDEIHALAPTKRGIHLALSLERLAHLVTTSGGADPQRIGLSATQRPLSEVARYLGGDRPVEIVDASTAPALDLQIVVPTPNRVKSAAAASPDLIYPQLLEMVVAHRSTIIFCNSRRLAERTAQELTRLAVARGHSSAPQQLGDAASPNGVGTFDSATFVRAHHGSVSRQQRLEIETALKAGRLRAITATSSLELGIDMGAVDLVLQVESPGAVSRGLQRIGRAGHHVGGTSVGRIFPRFQGDLLEAAVVARGMLDGEVETTRVPGPALDVLAQQVVAMVGDEPWSVIEAERVIRRAASYQELSRDAWTGVLDMLAGRYPSDAFAELRPRLTWDRQRNVLFGRKGARLLSVLSGGTIPDRGLYGVHIGPTGPKVGELDEEMVAESRPGETFILGASTWRIDQITFNRVIVSPAPGEPGKMPFWRNEGPGRPVELGRALGALCRQLDERVSVSRQDAQSWLEVEYRLAPVAAENLIQYIVDQRAHSRSVPTDRAFTVERFRDELGDMRVCVLSPFGSRIHAPWAFVLAHQLEAKLGYPVQPRWTDDGISLRFADGDAIPADEELFPDPDVIERLVMDELARSNIFAQHFRENAARALLLPRRRPGSRTPLWMQRLRAQQLMAVALRFPSFPITLETYREVMCDVFDLPALTALLRDVALGAMRVDSAITRTASPFARSLVFDYTAALLYQGDTPVAERKALALTLDRTLLRELIGESESRDLLDPQVIDDVETSLQQLAPDQRARSPDEIHDMVRRLGDLNANEIEARCSEIGDAQAAILQLVHAQRLVSIHLAGEARFIALEDVARYRDAFGIVLPDGLPIDLLQPTSDSLVTLVQRWVRTHALVEPVDVARRWSIPLDVVDRLLQTLAENGQLIRGQLGLGAESACDPDVMRKLRRRTLTKLRAQIAPVPAANYADFLVRWQGLHTPRHGARGLREAIVRLEGVALPFSELEASILPARVADYHPRMLDDLGAAGELVWIGAGALGAKDGRVMVLRRDRARELAPDPGLIANRSATHDRIERHLEQVGASFFVAIEAAAQAPRAEVVPALWDLVWAGRVTNDTFGSLRSRSAPRSRRTAPHAAFGGRWSLVEALGAAPPSTTRAHARAVALLERWGIVNRASARADEISGGFLALAEVFRAMEDAGTIRRGFFIDNLEGAQYAWPAAVDRLREPSFGHAPHVAVVAAVDPACAWGSVLEWPEFADREAKPARRVGASVVLVDGALALWVESKAQRISTASLPAETIQLALTVGIPKLAAAKRRRELLVQAIDGQPAATSRWSPALIAAGARIDYRGIAVRGKNG